MQGKSTLADFLIKEWLLLASAAGFVLTSLFVAHLPSYSLDEIEVLAILFTLFVAVKGLERCGFIENISNRLEKGKWIPLKLVLATFFLSMLITNDAALIVIIPLTLALNVERKDILIILEALAANAGSALTPFGNPQNLYIYWYYNLKPLTFITEIAPYSLVFLILLSIASLLVKNENNISSQKTTVKINKKSAVYVVLIVLVLLAVLRLLPVAVIAVVPLYVLLFDRKSLQVDYALLFSLFFFFGLADNMKALLAVEVSHSEHVFIFSALASQFLSNVPVALLFANFTTKWQALLWGTNAGGFGSLFGSIANLIAYKLYVNHKNINNSAMFTIKFLALGYISFFISIGLYFLVKNII